MNFFKKVPNLDVIFDDDSIHYSDFILLGTGFFCLNQIVKADIQTWKKNQKIKWLSTKLESHGNTIGDLTIW